MAAPEKCLNCGGLIPAPRPAVCGFCNTPLQQAPAAPAPVEAESSGGIGGFFKENWIWIAAPIVIVFLALLVLAYFFSDDGSSPFLYNVF